MTDFLCLKHAMITLDKALTGKDDQAAAKAAKDQSAMFEDPFRFLESGGYYLSDGGYSRVVYDEEHATFKLSLVSRDEVKQRWNSPQALAAAGHAGSVLTSILHASVARPA